MPSHYLLVTADRGKRPVVETNMDAELSGEEAGEMVVLAEDDYGLAMRRMFGEESGGGIRMRDSALGAASYSTASGGLGIQPGIVQSDEAFATYLQALLDENDAFVAPEVIQLMTADTILTSSIPSDEVFAAHLQSMLEENVVAPDIIEQMTAETMYTGVEHGRGDAEGTYVGDAVVPGTPRDRRNNKRAAECLGFKAPKRVRLPVSSEPMREQTSMGVNTAAELELSASGLQDAGVGASTMGKSTPLPFCGMVAGSSQGGGRNEQSTVGGSSSRCLGVISNGDVQILFAFPRFVKRCDCLIATLHRCAHATSVPLRELVALCSGHCK